MIRRFLPCAVLALSAAALPALAAPKPDAATAAHARRSCRPVFAAAGLRPAPALSGSEAPAQMLLAVDHRIERCRVLIRASDRSVIAEPDGSPSQARLQPARGG